MAEFVGGTNIITGTASKGPRGWVHICIPGRQKDTRGHQAHSWEGTEAMLSVRDQQLTLTTTMPTGSDCNVLGGTIMNIAYSGFRQRRTCPDRQRTVTDRNMSGEAVIWAGRKRVRRLGVQGRGVADFRTASSVQPVYDSRTRERLNVGKH